MGAFRRTSIGVAVLVMLLAVGVAIAAEPSRSVGQTIDDTVITTEIKAKLAADKLSNLTKIGVSTKKGVVTLSGTVDSLERQERAGQIASSVKGVLGVVNTVQVASTGSPGSTVSVPPPAVDATGVVARVDPSTGTITLQDGRVLRATNGTMVWQPSNIQALRPGTQVLLRGAAPVGLERTVATAAPEWRMGTVRSVDAPTAQIVLTDNTLVRVAPSAYIHRGADRLVLEQLAPGSEVVIRTLPPATGSAEGSAAPGQMATAPTLDAAEINVVWAPSAFLR
jgi:hyperosmotically inducible protein